MMNTVELLPLPPGDTMQSMIPSNYILAKVEEVGSGSVVKEMSAICCVVEKMEEQVNTAKHLVAVNRTRCILREVNSQDRSFCWFFGSYSDSMKMLGVMEMDLVMICCPTVVRTKLKPKQVLPPNMSIWTIHCLDIDPQPSVTFFRQDEHQSSKEVEVNRSIHQVLEVVDTERPQQLLDESQLVVALNNSPLRKKSPQQTIATMPVVRRAAPATLAGKSPPMRPHYTPLSSCTTHKKRYNVFAVLSEVLETPRRRKSKIVTKLTIQDESLWSCGDLRDYFKFDILSDSIEQVPVLEAGAVLRINHMVVEVFSGRPDGRVFSGNCVTVVEGGVGDTITPINTRKGENMNWGEEDDKRVTELRKWLRERNMAGLRKVRTIEEIVGECETDLSCRLVTASRAEDGLVVRVEDGTCSQVVTVEYRGQDTNTQEEAGNNKHFIDVWVRNSILVDRMKEQDMKAGDWMRMDKVKCVQEVEGGELPAVFRFMVQDGGISKLGEGDLEVACMRERMGEDMMESQADSYVDRILTAVNMEGSFSFPESQEEDNLVVEPQPSTVTYQAEREEDSDALEIETGDKEEHRNLLQRSSPEASGIFSEDALYTSKSVVAPVPTVSTDISSPVAIISTDISTPLNISVAQPVSPALPEISLPSPGSEISFPLLEKSLSTPLTPTPPSLPPGQITPAILQIPETMSSQMTEFDCQGSPIRLHPDSPSLMRSDSTPSQPYFTPPDSPVVAGGRRSRSREGRLEESKESSSDTEEEMDRSESAAMDSVEVVNLEEESNVISPNTMLEATSGPNIMRKETVKTLNSLNNFRSHLMVVCPTLTNIPRVHFTEVSSTSLGRFRLLGSISHVEQEGDKLELVRGLCQECGKLDTLEMFEQRGSDIFCCKRGRVTLCAKKILHVVMFLTDGKGEEVKLVVSDEEAEMFLRCSTKQFIVDMEIRDIVMNKVKRLKGVLGDFGVEKSVLGNFNVFQSLMKA